MSSSAAERLAQRYPPSRVPRWLVIVVLAALAAVALSWLVVVAVRQSSPPVSAQITSFEVVSDREVIVTMTVQRPDPSLEVSCEIFAEANNHERVGELLDLRVPPIADEQVTVTATLDTFRRTASVSVAGCRVVD